MRRAASATVSLTPYGPSLAASVAGHLERGGRCGYVYKTHCWLVSRGPERFSFEVETRSPPDKLMVMRPVFEAKKGVFSDWLSGQSPKALADHVTASIGQPEGSPPQLLTQEDLEDDVRRGYGVAERVRVGEVLAERVAAYLQLRGHISTISNVHRDFCGMGLFFDPFKGRFHHCEFHDGFPNFREGAERQDFGTKEEFVLWLSDQTDESFRGAMPPITEDAFFWDNQRLTRQGIIEKLQEGLEREAKWAEISRGAAGAH